MFLANYHLALLVYFFQRSWSPKIGADQRFLEIEETLVLICISSIIPYFFQKCNKPYRQRNHLVRFIEFLSITMMIFGSFLYFMSSIELFKDHKNSKRVRKSKLTEWPLFVKKWVYKFFWQAISTTYNIIYMGRVLKYFFLASRKCFTWISDRINIEVYFMSTWQCSILKKLINLFCFILHNFSRIFQFWGNNHMKTQKRLSSLDVLLNWYLKMMKIISQGNNMNHRKKRIVRKTGEKTKNTILERP